jgi:hypothetical protein
MQANHPRPVYLSTEEDPEKQWDFTLDVKLAGDAHFMTMDFFDCGDTIKVYRIPGTGEEYGREWKDCLPYFQIRTISWLRYSNVQQFLQLLKTKEPGQIIWASNDQVRYRQAFNDWLQSLSHSQERA